MLKLFSILFAFVALAASSLAQQAEPLFLGDRASFVKDVTYGDGTVVTAGAKITKTWKIHNRGLVAWDKRELRLDGDAQGFVVVKSVPFSANLVMDVDVSVELKVPSKPGRYKLTFKQWAKKDGKWQLAFPDRYKSGVYLDIVVK